jgi:hypothetical protein
MTPMTVSKYGKRRREILGIAKDNLRQLSCPPKMNHCLAVRVSLR